ncbi:MAG: sulfurtransferase TusA family protein [Alphaproteobacteria bacterium]|nr:sulfurtransferase TusA family protein [Alphaproteobacteria bacterium]MBU1525661.1 sulfurtransferase TusA family protein [Alphaproteobacteria bacterium]MBU2116345.1 sulfurtransferase TusA family protein [Alphaproteobacteria bacterium]MBU2351958.1 sulfurtransferase TusA family protein [Alphaproteobacteria bacterium]MBU2383735.1 sulfurtransferase TusA family protein [Alphaproteobacteria bacterium]
MSPLVVDARGHHCPVPSLRLRKALEAAAPGATVVLLADDPMARIDVPHLLLDGPHRLVSVDEVDGALRFSVASGGRPD